MSQELMEGRIHSVVYSKEETGWSVLRLAEPDGSLGTVVGCIPFPAPGEWLVLAGRWVNHPSHGSQFAAERIDDRRMPEDEDAILEYLASGAVRGIGRATARLLVDAFGADTLRIMEEDSEGLTAVKGITAERARGIAKHFRTQTGIRRLMELLARYELAPSLALELSKVYGTSAMDCLRHNPYLLSARPYLAPFAPTDKLAESFGVETDDERRIRAGFFHELEYNLDNGHAYIPKTSLIRVTSELLDLEEEHIQPFLEGLVDHSELRCPDGDKVYLPELYAAEINVADFAARQSRRRYEVPRDLVRLVSAIEKELGVTYAEKQRLAVMNAAEKGIMILTGGPGTGKTTTVKGILRLFDHMGLKVSLAAPTGRAAKRMSELTDRSATTIHRMLEYGFDPESGTLGFQRHGHNPLQADAVIVDECSMVDVLLMESILAALKENARLILIGDPDQLPAVGPGNVLEDLLTGARVPSVRLTEIFRQAAQSRIVTGAHSINRGDIPPLANEKNSDFFYMRRREMLPAIDTIRELCASRLPAGLGLESGQIQVLSPTRKGPCGTVSLNKVLQEALNPAADHKLEKRYGEFVFREGDRVMQTRNNYNLNWQMLDGIESGTGIFNGEIGTITEINERASLMNIRFDDREAQYPFDNLGELEPAYAMTVHKSQGSEYEAVVLALMPGAPKLMTRRVLYTAVTRAKRYLVIVGQDSVLETMVKNAKRSRRYSGLAQWLSEEAADDNAV